MLYVWPVLYRWTVVETLGGEMYGGEGVGWVGRYLWCTPPSEKAKMN